MRFLRRGGRDDELAVEREDDVAPAASDEAAPLAPDDEAPVERADLPVAADHDALPLQAADELTPVHTDDEARPGASAGEALAVEAADAASLHAGADPSPDSAIGDAGSAGDAGDETGVPGEAAGDATPGGSAAETPATDRAAASEPFRDPDSLAGLVAGGVRPAIRAASTAEDIGPDPLAGGRPAALRVAGLHLRTGQLPLARAELEALAGRGRLDDAALLDLAEVRWRTGDLGGAGEAANALLARGGEETLALVIAAESVAGAGRPVEARRLSARALEVADGPLDPLFAGMPRAMIWPAPTAPSVPEPSAGAPRRRSRRARAEADGAPSTASEAFAGGRAALARGDANRAGLLLGVAMRLEPAFAEDVLRAVTGRDDQPILALVRGDALRLLGREAEALEAFDRARGRSAATPPPDRNAGPGLFDDDLG